MAGPIGNASGRQTRKRVEQVIRRARPNSAIGKVAVAIGREAHLPVCFCHRHLSSNRRANNALHAGGVPLVVPSPPVKATLAVTAS